MGNELCQRLAHKPEWLLADCGKGVDADEEVETEQAQWDPDNEGVEEGQYSQACSYLVTWLHRPRVAPTNHSPTRGCCAVWRGRECLGGNCRPGQCDEECLHVRLPEVLSVKGHGQG